MVTTPIRVEDEGLPLRAAPALGADTDAILREAGFSDDTIRDMRAQGIV